MSNELGIDRSGNSNNWTVNNMTLAVDQMLDTPTNNFPTFNPLNKNGNIAFSEGNLAMVGDDTDYRASISTMAALSGKWYAEFHPSAMSAVDKNVGIYRADNTYDDNTGLGNYTSGTTWSYSAHGLIRKSGTTQDTEATFTDGDIIQVAMDLDNDKLYFGKNNTWINSGDPTSGATGTGAYAITSATGVPYHFAATTINSGGAGKWVANFGQDSSFAGNKTAQGNGGAGEDFYYTPPSGFKSLRTANLPAVDVIPSEHFNPVAYTGDGTTDQDITVGFQPDFVWIKNLPRTESHNLFDSVRGPLKQLYSNGTSVEYEHSTTLTSFDSNGFSLSSENSVNRDTEAYISWNWKAGNATLGTGSFTQGTIASTCSRNVDAGFSIVSWTGTSGENQTVGHGLSSTPEIIIIKGRENTSYWVVINPRLVNTTDTNILYLNASSAEEDDHGTLGDNLPTATTFGVDTYPSVNEDGEGHIAYCWHSVEGYSKFGTYTGNGNADGTFVYTGFRPTYFLTKRTTTAADDWYVYDSKRSTFNTMDDFLKPNATLAETVWGALSVDFLSNGVKMRGDSTGTNASGDSYIYMAFAETPFKYANAK